MAVDDLVEALAVGCRDVLHVGGVLQAALYLERRGAGLYEPLQVVALVHVLQREQVAVVFKGASVGIDEVELHAAELCALATVGAAAEAMLRGVAEARIADAEGSVDEDLELHLGHVAVYGCYLVDGELASEHHPAEALLRQPAHLGAGAVVGLGGGMQRQRTVGYQRHVLHQDGVDTGAAELADEPAGG